MKWFRYSLCIAIFLALFTGTRFAQVTILSKADNGIMKGTIITRVLELDAQQKYYLYVPFGAAANAKLLVIVHGLSRKADEYMVRFRSLADRYGVILVAPLFSEDRFPAYQTLGTSPKTERSDHMLNAILRDVTLAGDLKVGCVYLFGYSAGGQFVHRYAMAYPKNVAGVAIGAAGWYTFPDPQLPFPRGLGPTLPPGIKLNPAEFLKVPTAVFVGERDYHRDRWLNKSRAIDAHQGYTRIERAAQWVKAMKSAAAGLNLAARIELQLIPAVGHSFADAMERGRLSEAIARFFFVATANEPRHEAAEPRSVLGDGCQRSAF